MTFSNSLDKRLQVFAPGSRPEVFFLLESGIVKLAYTVLMGFRSFLITSTVVLAATCAGVATVAPQMFSVSGTVTDISPSAVSIQIEKTPMTLWSSKGLQVWKGTLFHDLSSIQVGDQIYARYYRDQAGRLIAVKIWATSCLYGAGLLMFRIKTSRYLPIQRLTPPDAYRKESKTVEYDANTVFQDSRPSDLIVGREVLVIGVLTQNAKVLATRVTVYEGNKPVRMGHDGSIMPRTK